MFLTLLFLSQGEAEESEEVCDHEANAESQRRAAVSVHGQRGP